MFPIPSEIRTGAPTHLVILSENGQLKKLALTAFIDSKNKLLAKFMPKDSVKLAATVLSETDIFFASR